MASATSATSDMSKEAIKQRKLLVKKLKERGVSITNPLFEHGIRSEKIHGANNFSDPISRRSCMTRAKGNKKRGYNAPHASVQTTKVILKHIPITLSIAELAKASGMFKGTGGTRNFDHSNGVADQFEKTHKKESRKTQSRLSMYYTKYGKGWKISKKPLDGQPS